MTIEIWRLIAVILFIFGAIIVYFWVDISVFKTIGTKVDPSTGNRVGKPGGRNWRILARASFILVTIILSLWVLEVFSFNGTITLPFTKKNTTTIPSSPDDTYRLIEGRDSTGTLIDYRDYRYHVQWDDLSSFGFTVDTVSMMKNDTTYMVTTPCAQDYHTWAIIQAQSVLEYYRVCNGNSIRIIPSTPGKAFGFKSRILQVKLQKKWSDKVTLLFYEAPNWLYMNPEGFCYNRCT